MSDRASRTKGLLWVVAGCLLGGVFAVGLSPLAHMVPWGWEKKLGTMLDISFIHQECHSVQGDVALKKLTARLYPLMPDDGDFSIEVHMVKDPIVNAYATLGGVITLNSGLLTEATSPDEVAGVLAHEIEHVRRRHIMEGMITHLFTVEGISTMFGAGDAAEWSRYFLSMDFTRAQESQADEGGLQRLQKAHIDNQGYKHFFERMGKSSTTDKFLSDHPANEKRIEMISRFPNDNPTPVLTQEEWKSFKTKCID